MNLLTKMTATLRSFWLSKASISDFHAPGGPMPAPVGEGAVLAISAAWASLNLLVGTIASLPLMVYRDNGKGGREIARDHSLYRLLHESPNTEQTTLDFWEQMGLSLELRGNAYAQIQRIGEKVVALAAIHPDMMQVRRIDGELAYLWSDERGARRQDDAREILHIRGFGGSPLGGLSALSHARSAFAMAREINTAAQETFVNGLRPSGLLTFDKTLTPEKRAELEKLLVDKFQGAMNAGRPMLLEAGGRWEQLTFKPDEAQMLESRAFSVEEIARIFGVPPHMIGHTAKATSWGTGLEQQVLGFQKFSLRRRLKRIELALMKQLLTPADRAAGIVIEFNVEGLLRGDSAARAKFYQLMLASGVMTINEVRALENLPPVDGGGVPRIQMQNVPITEAGGIGETGPAPEADDAQDT